MLQKSAFKFAISYVLVFILSIFLMRIVWGFTSGAVLMIKTSQNQEFAEKGEKLENLYGVEVRVDELTAEQQREVKDLILYITKSINWFLITFVVSALVFSIAGFILGFINRDFLYVGIVIILTFIFGNPIVFFKFANELSGLHKIIIIIFAQFGVCYLFGYLGALLGKKIDQKRLRELVVDD